MKKPELTDEQKTLFDKLNNFQKRVCVFILEGNHQNDAYIMAGSRCANKASVAASVCGLLKLPHVKAFMDSVLHERISDTIMKRDEALEILSNLARASISKLADFDTIDFKGLNGKVATQTIWSLKEQGRLSQKELAWISELSAGRDGFKFKIHNVQQAIKQLSEMQGWDAPKKLDVPAGVSISLNFDGKRNS